MATYIPQIQGYLPEVQPFKPDYNFYGNVLGTLQQRYDKGHEQLSKLYGKLLTSPLSRTDSIEKRNEFFKQAEKSISQIAGLDLSKEQNVRAAQKIFDPLYNNDHIMKDMAFTANHQKQLGTANTLKNCLDPDDCNGLSYWDEGVQYLNYQMEDFRNASEDEMLSFGNSEFIANVDVFDQATKLAKKMDLNISRDSITNKWLVKNSNGDLVSPYLNAAFHKSLGNNQMIKNKYNVEAYTSRRNYIANQGDNPAAEQDYVNMIAKEFENFYGRSKEEIEKEKNSITQDKKALNEQKKNAKGNAGSLVEELFAKNTASLNSQEEDINSYEASLDKQIVANNRFGINAENADHMYSKLLMERDFNDAAKILSQKGAATEIKSNPYGLKDYDYSIWKKKNEIEFNQDIFKKNVDFEHDLILQGKKKTEEGTIQIDDTTFWDPKTGSFYIDETAAFEQNKVDYKTTADTPEAQKEINIKKGYEQINIDKSAFKSNLNVLATSIFQDLTLGLNTSNKESYKSILNKLGLENVTDITKHLKENPNFALNMLNELKSNPDSYKIGELGVNELLTQNSTKLMSNLVDEQARIDVVTNLKNASINSAINDVKTNIKPELIGSVENAQNDFRKRVLDIIASNAVGTGLSKEAIKNIIMNDPDLKDSIRPIGLAFDGVDSYSSPNKVIGGIPIPFTSSGVAPTAAGYEFEPITKHYVKIDMNKVLEDIDFDNLYGKVINKLQHEEGGQGSVVTTELNASVNNSLNDNNAFSFKASHDYLDLKPGDKVVINNNEMEIGSDGKLPNEVVAFKNYLGNKDIKNKSFEYKFNTFNSGANDESKLNINWTPDKDTRSLLNLGKDSDDKSGIYNFEIIRKEDPKDGTTLFRKTTSNVDNHYPNGTDIPVPSVGHTNLNIRRDDENFSFNFTEFNVDLNKINPELESQIVKVNQSNINYILGLTGNSITFQYSGAADDYYEHVVDRMNLLEQYTP